MNPSFVTFVMCEISLICALIGKKTTSRPHFLVVPRWFRIKERSLMLLRFKCVSRIMGNISSLNPNIIGKQEEVDRTRDKKVKKMDK